MLTRQSHLLTNLNISLLLFLWLVIGFASTLMDQLRLRMISQQLGV
ncbi:hypothetical protein Golax_015259 [Gossypium laxum]|uniref:Uncharacterized protein n=1 Tax=Gossypium laxum TaxID=34288 RepID=A0A7J8ZX98_9ROSI|nr:hypothetical protein [Gossypium laxum]